MDPINRAGDSSVAATREDTRPDRPRPRGTRAAAAAVGLVLIALLSACAKMGTAGRPAAAPIAAAGSASPSIPDRAVRPPARTERSEEAPVVEVRPDRSTLSGTTAAGSASGSAGDYRIGEEDELRISIYGDEQLDKAQIVRPGGKISFPFIGEIRASGLTVEELSGQIQERLARFVKDPRVTVIVVGYNSKRVSVLGQVRSPGLFRLASDITLMEGISRAGGLTENADLQGALLVRDAQIMPVDFGALFRRGDLNRNVTLQAGDVVLIPNLQDKKVFVLGEVNRPLTLVLRPGVTLLDAVGQAGGFTRDAKKTTVIIVRGGLGDPRLLRVNVERLTAGNAHDLALEAGDVVYVPRTLVADVVRFFQNLSSVLTPAILAETGIVLGPAAKAALTGHGAIQQVVVPTPTQ